MSIGKRPSHGPLMPSVVDTLRGVMCIVGVFVLALVIIWCLGVRW